MMTKIIAKALVLGAFGLVALGGAASFAQTSNPSNGRMNGQNPQLATNIEQALQNSRQLKPYEFTVSARGRNVTLEGAVFSEQEAAEAARIAQHVPGVKWVNNQIVVNATGN